MLLAEFGRSNIWVGGQKYGGQSVRRIYESKKTRWVCTRWYRRNNRPNRRGTFQWSPNPACTPNQSIVRTNSSNQWQVPTVGASATQSEELWKLWKVALGLLEFWIPDLDSGLPPRLLGKSRICSAIARLPSFVFIPYLSPHGSDPLSSKTFCVDERILEWFPDIRRLS